MRPGDDWCVRADSGMEVTVYYCGQPVVSRLTGRACHLQFSPASSDDVQRLPDDMQQLVSDASQQHNNSSADDIANVSTFTQCAPEATEFGEIAQNKRHYAVQGHSRSPTGTNRKLIYDFLLVINTNLPPVLHRFRDIAFDRFKIAIFGYPLSFSAPDGGVPVARYPYYQRT